VTSQGQTAGTDELERLFQRLVLNVAQLDPARLDGPVPIVEIHQNLVPYRTHRATLGVDTNQDYEMVVLRLLAGERGYAHVEPDEVRALLEREATSANPETGIFRRFPSASVHFDPDQVHVVLAGAAVPAPGRGAGAVLASGTPDQTPGTEPPAEHAFEIGPPVAADDDAGPTQAELPFSLEQEPEEPLETSGRDIVTAGAQCGYCGGGLPVGRTVIFCPHCGQNVGVMHCPVCGTELDVGWQYCITCGREMAGLG